MCIVPDKCYQRQSNAVVGFWRKPSSLHFSGAAARPVILGQLPNLPVLHLSMCKTGLTLALSLWVVTKNELTYVEVHGTYQVVVIFH